MISVPDLPFLNESGLVKMKNLLCVANVCYQLPWNKRELLHVANYHSSSNQYLLVLPLQVSLFFYAECSLPDSLQETTEHLLSSMHMLLREHIPSASLSCFYNYQYEYFVER